MSGKKFGSNSGFETLVMRSHSQKEEDSQKHDRTNKNIFVDITKDITKERTLHKSLARPHLEYANKTWNP